LLGAAGVGKSRLSSEFLASVAEEASVLHGRCLNYGEGISFYPVREAVKQAAGIGEADDVRDVLAKLEKLVVDEDDCAALSEQIAQMMGFVEGVASSEEIFWSVRRLFEALARERPLVVVFDDIHWGEDTFLDLVEHVADWSRDAPILLLCAARPELLDNRPAWGGGKMNATSLLLEALGDDEVDRLVVHLLGDLPLPAEVKQRVAAAAEGNPLFVEQMIAMLLDEELIKRSNGGWVVTGHLSELSVPPTVQALIASRLDRVALEERQVLERASVVGAVFYRGAIVELGPEDQRPEISGRLMNLVRRELIRPERAEFAGQDGFRFRHILIRDAAYEAMPKQVRADLHERFAGWFERLVGERVAEYEEIIGHHLEPAFRYRRDLGPLSDVDRALGNRAAERLARGGHRAFGRGDMTAAANLLRRALDVTAGELRRTEFHLDLAEIEIERGDFSVARRVLDEVAVDSVRDNLVLKARRYLLDAFMRLQLDANVLTAEIASEVDDLIRELESAQEHRVLAKAYRALGMIANHACNAAWMREVSERAIHHARLASDAWEESESLHWLMGSYGFGPTPVDECIRRLNDVLKELTGQPKLTCSVQFWLGVNLARSGRVEEGLELMLTTHDLTRDMGMTMEWAVNSMGVGWITMATGDLETAESALREGYAALDAMGEKSYLSTVAATLAEVRYRRGDYADAERFATIALETGAPDDLATFVLAEMVRAKLLARRGDHDEALELARDTIACGSGSDYMLLTIEPLVDLAEVLRLGGRREEAIATLERALEGFRAKKDVLGTARVEAKLAELSSRPGAPGTPSGPRC
ncbi:MAG: ATP-binding protein, partial [Actinomycetota bacterium]